MHENNIILLQKEALRLIELETKTLAAMCDAPGLLTQEKQEQVQTLDQQSAKNHMNILDGERIKLEKLDMVLAVVGTMKAGKSTTINAIVGTEVLPNRNGPMTAIPTLIRHTPGQVDPKLTLPHLEPIENLRGKIHARLTGERSAEILTNILKSNKDLHELARDIKNESPLKTHYTGADEIFYFLKGLNDLVRLAPLLGLEFPFKEFSNVDKLPIICIEFSHISPDASAAGTLTLLDTPGPNEAKQAQLLPMLKEQLRKASAILAVFDYTQLTSEADDQVRKYLTEISGAAQGRIYALINKFDGKNSKSMKKDDVRNFVYDLLKNEQGELISKQNIFPVSSQNAYLANRARQTIKQRGELPLLDPENPSWADDFCEKAFGTSYDNDDISDSEEVTKRANKLWNSSHFHEPLEGVILVAHAHAAILAVDSAAAKLVDVAQAMQNICATRETALQKNTSELHALVKALKSDIKKIEECEILAAHQQKKNLDRFKRNLKEQLDSLVKITTERLESYFKDGKKKEAQIIDTINSSAKSKPPRNRHIWSAFISETPNLEAQEQHFASNSREINFRQDKNAADDLVKKIQGVIESVKDSANREIAEGLENLLTSFEMDFQSEVVNEANKVLTELTNRMNKEGFEGLNIKLPKRNDFQLKLSGVQMLSDAIEEQERIESRLRRQDGVLSGTKRWFGDIFNTTWGYENYSISVTDYKVNIDNIREKVMASISTTFSNLDTLLISQVQRPLQKSVDIFFEMFRTTIDKVRGDLLQSLGDKDKDKEAQELIITSLRKLKKSISTQLMDTQALEHDVKDCLPPTAA